MALGAFLAGMVVGRSEFSLRAASEALPMRDAFAVLFFVSVGMLFDPARAAASRPGWSLATLAIVLVGKPLVALVLVVLLLRLSVADVPLTVAVALAQIGEFSFILADAGPRARAPHHEATNTLVAAVDRLDRAQPAAVPGVVRSSAGSPRGRRSGRPQSRAVGAVGTADVPKAAGSPIPTTARSSSATGRPGAPSRACCATTASRRPSSS